MTGHFHEKAGPCQSVFLGRVTVHQTADQREAHLPQPFLLRKVFVRRSIQPTADQREAHKAAFPGFSNHRLALLPSALFVELLLRCQLGVLNWNGCCCLLAELSVSVSSDVVPGPCRSHPNSAICSLSPVKRQLSSVPAVRCDFAMARTLHPLPTADEAGSLVFAQLPLPLFSCHAFRHV